MRRDRVCTTGDAIGIVPATYVSTNVGERIDLEFIKFVTKLNLQTTLFC